MAAGNVLRHYTLFQCKNSIFTAEVGHTSNVINIPLRVLKTSLIRVRWQQQVGVLFADVGGGRVINGSVWTELVVRQVTYCKHTKVDFFYNQSANAWNWVKILLTWRCFVPSVFSKCSQCLRTGCQRSGKFTWTRSPTHINIVKFYFERLKKYIIHYPNFT